MAFYEKMADFCGFLGCFGLVGRFFGEFLMQGLGWFGVAGMGALLHC